MKTLKYVFLFAIILCNLNHNVMCQIHIDTISSSYYKGITQHPPKNDYDRLVKEYLINKGEIKEDKESSIYVYELLNSFFAIDSNGVGLFELNMQNGSSSSGEKKRQVCSSSLLYILVSFISALNGISPPSSK